MYLHSHIWAHVGMSVSKKERKAEWILSIYMNEIEWDEHMDNVSCTIKMKIEVRRF